MSMSLCISANELRQALMDMEVAEANGFMHCLAVFNITSAGTMLSEVRAEYSDLLERAHATDARYDWGRFQRVSKTHRFVDGQLVPLTEAGAPA